MAKLLLLVALVVALNVAKSDEAEGRQSPLSAVAKAVHFLDDLVSKSSTGVLLGNRDESALPPLQGQDQETFDQEVFENAHDEFQEQLQDHEEGEIRPESVQVADEIIVDTATRSTNYLIATSLVLLWEIQEGIWEVMDIFEHIFLSFFNSENDLRKAKSSDIKQA
uniref:RxLR effector protein n=1 Tax=Spongospora subterranea TaxID=70186 RepID=A0A0H5RBD7_9EUKA|eukprot:CRZ11525.1 hypothetical protein [Spongospora subterranea]